MYYVVDDLKNLTESLTKEQILAAIVQAVEQHAVADVDTGFVTMLKEQNYGNALKMWVGTTADYNALETKEDNCLYLLSDDATYDDLIASISRVKQIQNEALAKNGAVILNTAVAYGWNLAVDIDNTIPIDSFSIVKVRVRFAGETREVLCSVDVQGNTVFICGAGSIGTSSVVFRIARVQLEINKTTKKLIENSTVIVPFVEDGSTDTLVKATIDKITGVM
ncbi:MAG: hypothetical protein IKG80_04130 [Clostridia bacterium]|nr:hypothetical protein [Exiguobacterium sp.]MBR3423658.1 hypothetical protein [Clostridia bacterium]